MRNLDRISSAYDYQPNQVIIIYFLIFIFILLQLQNPNLHPYATMESQFGLRNSGRYESLKKVEQPYTQPPSIGTISSPQGYYAMYETLTVSGKYIYMHVHVCMYRIMKVGMSRIGHQLM